MATPKTSKTKSKKADADADAAVPSGGTMKPPKSGVTVRMYRHGHGDCFLLAFRGDGGRPVYVLIDCGMKKGSQVPTKDGVLCDMPDVAKDIAAATGGHLHLVVITHEHEDHVSGFLSEQDVFSRLTIDAVWLAWTDEPGFKLADDLRKKYHDVLLGLIGAADKLNQLAGGDPADARTANVVNALLEFDLPDPADRGLAAAAGKIAGITNKKAIKVVTDRAAAGGGRTEYLHPHAAPRTLPGVPGVRVFALGPPENEARLKDMDPKGAEEFHLAAAEERSFLAAVADAPAEAEAHQPFALRYRIPADQLHNHPAAQAFFANMYGPTDPAEADDAAAWRRIDGDWLRSSETFALRMSNLVNNTSLVLAVELPQTKKVLLFVGDAQRGNWVSWHEKACPDGAGGEVTVADLLGRTVFYKVGHHGSHNATMNKGGLQDMAKGPLADEFVAMIPAHQKWAEALKPPWMHPLKEIEAALRKKAKGRVFIADRVLEKPSAHVLSETEWDRFQECADQKDLYHEFTVRDE